MIPLLLGLMTIVCYIWYKLSIRRFEKCGLPSHRTYTVFGDTLRVLKMKTYEPKGRNRCYVVPINIFNFSLIVSGICITLFFQKR